MKRVYCNAQIRTVFVQERLVSIVENSGCKTNRKCEVYGCVEEDFKFSESAFLLWDRKGGTRQGAVSMMVSEHILGLLLGHRLGGNCTKM